MPKGMIYIYICIYMTNKTHDIWGCLNQWDIRAVVAIKHPLKMVVHPIKLRTKSPRVGEDHSKIEGKCRRCRQTIDPVLSISPLPKNIQQIFNNKSTINHSSFQIISTYMDPLDQGLPSPALSQEKLGPRLSSANFRRERMEKPSDKGTIFLNYYCFAMLYAVGNSLVLLHPEWETASFCDKTPPGPLRRQLSRLGCMQPGGKSVDGGR